MTGNFTQVSFIGAGRKFKKEGRDLTPEKIVHFISHSVQKQAKKKARKFSKLLVGRGTLKKK